LAIRETEPILDVMGRVTDSRQQMIASIVKHRRIMTRRQMSHRVAKPGMNNASITFDHRHFEVLLQRPAAQAFSKYSASAACRVEEETSATQAGSHRAPPLSDMVARPTV
jgi:hypothetical protein